MNLLLLIFLSVLALIQCLQEGQLQGQYETKDGSICVWFELRKSKGVHIFATACHRKNEQGGRQSYSCEYGGPMEECDIYQTNPKDFYSMVAAHLKGIHGVDS